MAKLFSDFGMIVISFLLAKWYLSQDELRYVIRPLDTGLLFFLLTGWYFTATYYTGLYSTPIDAYWYQKMWKVLKNVIAQGLLIITFSYFIDTASYQPNFLYSYLFSLMITVPAGKLAIKWAYLYLYEIGKIRKSSLVIGSGESGKRFCKFLRENKHYGYRLIRYIPGNISVVNNYGLNAQTLLVNGEPLSDLHEIDEIFISDEPNVNYNIQELTQVLSSFAVRLRILPKTFSTGPYSFSMVGGFPLFSYRSEPLEDIYNRIAKRSFDILFSLTVIIFVFSWLFPILAILIKLGSSGPVFYKQERWGKRNRPFWCFKFRSMYMQAPSKDESGAFQQARKGDPRVTWIGAILRKTSLDELPQFFNVLFGEMSVVGPRPHASLMNTESLGTIDNYMVRHQAKPGITGWAQVNGLRGESNRPGLLKRRVEHDIWYIENWTFLLDIKIIVMTVRDVIIGDKHAY